MDIFSTREMAMSFWSLIFMSLLLINTKTRKSIIDILKIIFTKNMMMPFFIILIYLKILMMLFIFRFKMGQYVDLKEILLWVLFSGVPLCYGVVNKEPNKDYIKEIIKDNIKFIILLEFIISTFTFPLGIELIIVPVFTLLFLLEIVFDMKEEYKDVNKFISYILSISGFIILYKSFSLAIQNYKELNSIESLVTIITPIILTILYIPLIFIFRIYFNYKNILYRLKIKIEFRFEVINNKISNKQNLKYDYEIEKVEDISTGVAKRKNIILTLKEKYDIRDLENICMEQFALYNYKNDVVWIYVATNQENYIMSNWIMQAQWISSKLDKKWRLLLLSEVIKDGIYFKYNDKFDEREKYYKKHIFKDDKYLFINNFKLYDRVSEIVNPILELFRNGDHNGFMKICNEYKEDIKDIYFKYGNIGISTNINFKNYLQEFQNFIAIVDNIILYAVDESRESKNKEYLINMSVKELDNIIPKIEDERFYWMTKLNITVEEYEQAAFID
ncbi:MAG TPA: hypothetical protein VK071_08265 [Tissierellales bacterium]|nr:hypothetical protein [Tissierellales bacterium]